MKVCVVGAGACGLISAKHLLEAGIDFDVYEGNSQIGGTWLYSENFIDKHGLEKPTSMYKNLKTNLPKELMLFEGLDYNIESASFIPGPDVLDYLQTFSDKFHLNSKIKFEHLITKISRVNESWEVVVRKLSTGLQETYYYDSVFVCNGHYKVPCYPTITGAGSFPGHHIHSHYYRVPELYQDKTVLVVGLGPSALDITFDILPYVKKVYLSNHGQKGTKNPFPEKVIPRPDVRYIDGYNIHFIDGSEVEVDSILYCTGYKYDFPFLDKSCGIKVNENYVHPLYKQLVSISHNSMFFIGIPFRSFLFQLFELQVKCALKILSGSVELPRRDVMAEDTARWEKSLASEGVPQKMFHCIANCQKEYFTSVATLGGLPLPQPVFFRLSDHCNKLRENELATYRSKVYSIVDSEKFTCH